MSLHPQIISICSSNFGEKSLILGQSKAKGKAENQQEMVSWQEVTATKEVPETVDGCSVTTDVCVDGAFPVVKEK